MSGISKKYQCLILYPLGKMTQELKVCFNLGVCFNLVLFYSLYKMAALISDLAIWQICKIFCPVSSV